MITQEDAKALRELVSGAQKLLMEQIQPDGPPMAETINALLGLLDNNTVYRLMERTK